MSKFEKKLPATPGKYYMTDNTTFNEYFIVEVMWVKDKFVINDPERFGTIKNITEYNGWYFKKCPERMVIA